MMVPAIGEVWRRPLLHWNSPRVMTSLYACPPQTGQSKHSANFDSRAAEHAGKIYAELGRRGN
jgi:hypothetical protein